MVLDATLEASDIRLKIDCFKVSVLGSLNLAHVCCVYLDIYIIGVSRGTSQLSTSIFLQTCAMYLDVELQARSKHSMICLKPRRFHPDLPAVDYFEVAPMNRHAPP